MLSLMIGRHEPDKGLPPELTDKDAFLGHLGSSEKEISVIRRFRDRMYRTFTIHGKNNKERLIYAPDARLAFLQRKISILLEKIYRVRNPVHGFVKNKSVKTNALTHIRRRFLLNVDIENFFPTITENRIVGLLESLCIDSEVSEIIGIIVTYNGKLPQGSPASPLISNMICFKLDKELIYLSKQFRLLYTRYADDISLSSHQPMTAAFANTTPPPGYFDPDLLHDRFKIVFQANGFSLNKSKAHYADKFSRKIVTGLKVNEKINVDRRYIRNVRAALFSVKSLGIADAQKKFEEQYGGRTSLSLYLQGKISWIGHIKGLSDSTFRSLAIDFNKLFYPKKIKYDPSTEDIIEKSLWVVNNYEICEQGTGFFMKDVGFVTAAHCVKNSSEVSLTHPSKPMAEFTAKIRFIDYDRDLAILDHSIPEEEYLSLEALSGSPYKGEEVIAAGYPDFGPGDVLSLREGKILMLTPKHGVKMIEVSQKLSGGMSGGPILTKSKRVAGVIHKGGPEEGRDFAIDISVLYSMLASVTHHH